MTIDTRAFGTIDISEEGILEFNLPILGFESQKRYIILYDDEMGDSLAWLQSVSDKDICFIIIDPRALLASYSPTIQQSVLSQLELNQEDAVFRCLVVVPNQVSEATVNLKSPIIINPAKKLAAQVVLEEEYPIRALLRSIEGGLYANTKP